LTSQAKLEKEKKPFNFLAAVQSFLIALSTSGMWKVKNEINFGARKVTCFDRTERIRKRMKNSHEMMLMIPDFSALKYSFTHSLSISSENRGKLFHQELVHINHILI
jgi:hypothetical protein